MWQCSKSIGGGAATATDTTKGEPAPEPSSVGPKTKESSIAVAQAQPGHEFKQFCSVLFSLWFMSSNNCKH